MITIFFFAFSLFLSAFLLFWAQPLIAKMLLPLLGGAPAVWNTCMVFFQMILLLGYLYAHFLGRVLSLSKQQLIHFSLLSLSLLVLPIALNSYWQISVSSPISSLFIQLLLAVGIPLFLLSATAPLLQRWFSQSLHPQARDPYFLYSYSNLGSILALVSFPTWLEPVWGLQQQSQIWAWSYSILLLGFISCAVLMWRNSQIQFPSPMSTCERGTMELLWRRRLYWILLAFVPSSLLLGVTTALTTDVAAVPLFWVAPLAFYLLSFIIVFSRYSMAHANWMPYILKAQILLLFPFVFIYAFPYSFNYLSIRFCIHLAVFFITALICHGELVKTRPHTNELTEFYLWIALGGVLGGVFNALLAPLLFTSVVEYPLMLAVACMLRPVYESKREAKYPKIALYFDIVIPVGIFIFLAIAAWLWVHITGIQPWSSMILLYGFAAVLVFSFPERRLRFGLGIAALLLSALWFIAPFTSNILYAERNFFGTIRVVGLKHDRIHVLLHGTTLHGAEDMELAKKHMLITYYQPVHEILQAIQKYNPSIQVAVAGLGTGTIACMARKTDQFSFYEIDAAIVAIANNPRYFTYLQQCPPLGGIHLGDARLQLVQAKPQQFDVIVVDAFSSDAIPVHLLTKEALQLYLSKLTPHGVLAFNITNNYLDLKPILAAGAKAVGLIASVKFDTSRGPWQNLYFSSWWVVMARQTEDLGAIREDTNWQPLFDMRNTKVWTDNYSNIFEALKR